MTENDQARLLVINDGFIAGRALHVAAEIGIADHLADGPKAVDDLASATSTNPGALARMLRLLASYGVFTEVEPGRFALTPAGEHLRGDHPRSLRSFLRLGHMQARAFAEAEYSVRTGKPALERVSGQSFFDYLRDNPDLGDIFNAAMAQMGAEEDIAVADAYDFTGVRSIVDVGGGLGNLLRTILERHPETTGVLFDQPDVVATAQALIDKAGLAARCTVAAGDFFQEITPGADVYMIKSVIHDWPEDQAVTILDNCRKAMPADGKLLLLERVVPPGDAPHPSKPVDFVMLILLAGRERTAGEYTALLSQAGFRVTRTIETPSPISIIEAVPSSG